MKQKQMLKTKLGGWGGGEETDCIQNTAARHSGLTYWLPKSQNFSLDLLFQEQVLCFSLSFAQQQFSHCPGKIVPMFPQKEAINSSKFVREQLQLK